MWNKKNIDATIPPDAAADYDTGWLGSSLQVKGDITGTEDLLIDGSVEGLAHERLPIRTYQYHPEGAPGPKDNEPVFDAFLDDVREAVSRK